MSPGSALLRYGNAYASAAALHGRYQLILVAKSKTYPAVVSLLSVSKQCHPSFQGSCFHLQQYNCQENQAHASQRLKVCTGGSPRATTRPSDTAPLSPLGCQKLLLQKE